MTNLELISRLPDADRFLPLARAFTLAELGEDFGANFFNEETCRQWMLKRLHPQGARCPECGTPLPPKLEQRFWLSERVKCSCGKFFTCLTGTFLSGCQFDFREIILLAILLSLNVSDRRIADILQISQANVRIWRHRFVAIEKLQMTH